MDVGMIVYECMPAGFFTLYPPTHCDGFFWDNLEAISFFQGEHDVRRTGSTESGLWFIINVQLCGTRVIKGMIKNRSLVVSCTEQEPIVVWIMIEKLSSNFS